MYSNDWNDYEDMLSLYEYCMDESDETSEEDRCFIRMKEKGVRSAKIIKDRFSAWRKRDFPSNFKQQLRRELSIHAGRRESERAAYEVKMTPIDEMYDLDYLPVKEAGRKISFCYMD